MRVSFTCYDIYLPRIRRLCATFFDSMLHLVQLFAYIATNKFYQEARLDLRLVFTCQLTSCFAWGEGIKDDTTERISKATFPIRCFLEAQCEFRRNNLPRHVEAAAARS